MHSTPPTRPTLRLRKSEWDQHMSAKGLTTQFARAEHIGVSRTTVGRVEDGRMRPGEAFVAAVLETFPDLGFEDLFEVVPTESKREERR